MKTVYEAFDGKIFEDDKKCLDYERNLEEENVVKNIKFYNSNNMLMKLKNVDDINFYKIIIPTKEDYKALKEFFNNKGYCLGNIFSEGTWYRIDDIDERDYKIVSEKFFRIND